MNTFNLVLTTQKSYENDAKCEIWYNLLRFGDKNPIIFNSPIAGVLLIQSSVNPFDFIKFLREILEENSDYIKFIMKLIPIERVIYTDLELIGRVSHELIELHPELTILDSYAVKVRKRATFLHTGEIVSAITRGLNYKVSLQNPNWLIHVEIIGDVTGISVMKSNTILEVMKYKKNKLLL